MSTQVKYLDLKKKIKKKQNLGFFIVCFVSNTSFYTLSSREQTPTGSAEVTWKADWLPHVEVSVMDTLIG